MTLFKMVALPISADPQVGDDILSARTRMNKKTAVVGFRGRSRVNSCPAGVKIENQENEIPRGD